MKLEPVNKILTKDKIIKKKLINLNCKSKSPHQCGLLLLDFYLYRILSFDQSDQNHNDCYHYEYMYKSSEHMES